MLWRTATDRFTGAPKHCEDTRPGQQLEAAQRQYADFYRLISAKAVTLHTILLGVGGTCYTEHTLNQLKQLGLDHQRAIKLANRLHVHFCKVCPQACYH
eukprot:1156261-Pelagomonas_calceolata.AAC.1